MTALKVKDLGPRQLAWCKRKIRGFSAMRKAADRVRAQAEKSRRNHELSRSGAG